MTWHTKLINHKRKEKKLVLENRQAQCLRKWNYPTGGFFGFILRFSGFISGPSDIFQWFILVFVHCSICICNIRKMQQKNQIFKGPLFGNPSPFPDMYETENKEKDDIPLLISKHYFLLNSTFSLNTTIHFNKTFSLKSKSILK